MTTDDPWRKKIEADYASLRALVFIFARDLAAVRLRLEEVSKGGGEAPGADPQAEKEAAEKSDERERQRAEAFSRMRAEQGKGEEVDEDDLEYLSHAWVNK